MDSNYGNACSHAMGFPIRKSPDHSLLAATRSLSQLVTSFIACLRQGIHTHALSSLTIKSTSHPGLRRFHRKFRSQMYATFFALTCAPTIIARPCGPHCRHSNARQYSIVKDRECWSIQPSAFSDRLSTVTVESGLLNPDGLDFGASGTTGDKIADATRLLRSALQLKKLGGPG
jgi:hypothetical protein